MNTKTQLQEGISGKYIDTINDVQEMIKIRINKQSEQDELKDLIERNSILTVYKPIQIKTHEIKDQQDSNLDINQLESTQSSSSYQIIDLNPLISNAIATLQNTQQTIKKRNEKYRLPDKTFLKHITTTNISISNNNICQHLCSTLYHFLQEAVDKQMDGQVNNALLLIQPRLDQQLQTQYNDKFNYFQLAVAQQIQNNYLKSEGRPQRVAFINLTGKDSKENQQQFQSLSQHNVEYREECQLIISFLVYELNNNNNKQNQYIKESIDEQRASISYNQYKYIPLILEQNEQNKQYILRYKLFKIIFEDYVQRILSQFNPQYIALSLSFSDFLLYEPETIQYAIMKLRQMCNNKLIVHIDFDIQNQSNIHNQSNYQSQITQILNYTYQSFLFQNETEIEKQQNYQNSTPQLVKQINQNIEFYKIINFPYQQLEIRIPILTLYNKTIQSNDDFYKNYNKYSNLLLISNNKEQHLKIKINQIVNIVPTTQIYINYDDNLIILYKIQDNYGNSYIYYSNFDYQNCQSKNIKNLEINPIKLDYDSECNNFVVFYRNNCIYAYQDNLIKIYKLSNSNIQSFQISESQQTILKVAHHQRILAISEIQEEQQTNIDISQSSKSYRTDQTKIIQIQKKNEEQRKQENQTIKDRYLPNILQNSLYQTDNTSLQIVTLFGGENINKHQMMNSFQCLIIDQTQFHSYFIEKQKFYQKQSLKSYPGQIILEAQRNDRQEQLYVFLPGNNNKRKQKYNFPIIENNNYAQTLQLTQKNQNIQTIPITYASKYAIQINSFNNNQINQQLIYMDEAIIVWKFIIQMTYINQSIIKKKHQPLINIKQKSDKSVIQVYLQSKGIKREITLNNYGNITNEMEYVKQIQNINTIQLEQQNNNSIFKPIDQNNYAIETNDLFCVAYENYIIYDTTSQQEPQLTIYQFSYLLEDSYKINITDIGSLVLNEQGKQENQEKQEKQEKLEKLEVIQGNQEKLEILEKLEKIEKQEKQKKQENNK